MSKLTIWLPVLAVLALLAPGPAGGGEDEKAADGLRYAIRAAHIMTMAGDPISNGTILVAGGKIEAIGATKDITVPAGYEIVDGGAAWALPGWVDIHSHVGGSDINDMIYPTNPDLRVDDNVVPDNPLLVHARAGGVTTILFIPGSGTNMAGFGVLMKTAGKTPEEVILRFPGVLKVAQAGNPERYGGDLGYGRVGMNHLIRETMKEGLAYGRAWMEYERGDRAEPPPTSERYELFRGLAKKEFPILIHTQWVQVLQTTIRTLHDEFDMPCVLSHASFDSYRNGAIAADRGVAVNVGPRQIHLDARDGRIYGIAAEWYRRGVRNLSLNTDAPVIPEGELVVQAAAAVRFGLPEKVALEGLTITNAKQLMIDHRVGSLEVGKDADIVLHSGPPLDMRTRIVSVFVNGRPVSGLGAAAGAARPKSMLPDEPDDEREDDR
jgi:imidazolonepropionase-like amidohydrolase